MIISVFYFELTDHICSYVLQVVDYLFRIISTYLDSTPSSFQYRIGALYALYAIYHTQLCQPKVKVCSMHLGRVLGVWMASRGKNHTCTPAFLHIMCVYFDATIWNVALEWLATAWHYIVFLRLPKSFSMHQNKQKIVLEGV